MAPTRLFDKTTKLVDTCFREHSIIVHEGGTSSSKTYSILQALCIIAISEPDSVITVAGQDIPNLKRGSIRDLRNIIAENEEIKNRFDKYNKSDRIFQFSNGSIIEFNSYDDAQDAKNGKRHYLFVNEANGIPYDIFEELNVRTSKKTFIDFNPTTRFWAHDKLQGRQGVLWVQSNYLHNTYIAESVKKKILGYEPTPENVEAGTANEYRWKVYGLGEVGKLEGLIISDYEILYKYPDITEQERRMFGLDFGYVNDPTTLIEIVVRGNRMMWRQWIYEYNLTNRDIYDRMVDLNFPFGRFEITADSAEQKSIEELRRLGLRIKGAKKGPDSVIHGINRLLNYKHEIDVKSKDIVEEFNSYIWAKARDGTPLNKPIDKFNHAFDAGRYATEDLDRATVTAETWRDLAQDLPQARELA